MPYNYHFHFLSASWRKISKTPQVSLYTNAYFPVAAYSESFSKPRHPSPSFSWEEEKYIRKFAPGTTALIYRLEELSITMDGEAIN